MSKGRWRKFQTSAGLNPKDEDVKVQLGRIGQALLKFLERLPPETEAQKRVLDSWENRRRRRPRRLQEPAPPSGLGPSAGSPAGGFS